MLFPGATLYLGIESNSSFYYFQMVCSWGHTHVGTPLKTLRLSWKLEGRLYFYCSSAGNLHLRSLTCLASGAQVCKGTGTKVPFSQAGPPHRETEICEQHICRFCQFVCSVAPSCPQQHILIEIQYEPQMKAKYVTFNILGAKQKNEEKQVILI